MDINIIRKSGIIGAVLGMSMLSPIMAHAGCSQIDMTGTWYAYSMSVDSAGYYYPQTNECKVKLNSSGSIVASKSSCKMRTATGLVNVNITGGSVKASSNCKLSGSMKISSIYGTDTIKLEFGRVAKDKRTVSLVSYDTSDPTYITHMTAVKR